SLLRCAPQPCPRRRPSNPEPPPKTRYKGSRLTPNARMFTRVSRSPRLQRATAGRKTSPHPDPLAGERRTDEFFERRLKGEIVLAASQHDCRPGPTAYLPPWAVVGNEFTRRGEGIRPTARQAAGRVAVA